MDKMGEEKGKKKERKKEAPPCWALKTPGGPLSSEAVVTHPYRSRHPPLRCSSPSALLRPPLCFVVGVVISSAREKSVR